MRWAWRLANYPEFPGSCWISSPRRYERTAATFATVHGSSYRTKERWHGGGTPIAPWPRRILSALVEPRAGRDPLFEEMVEALKEARDLFEEDEGIAIKITALLAKLETSNAR